jgi:hypothetical protein
MTDSPQLAGIKTAEDEVTDFLPLSSQWPSHRTSPEEDITTF